MKTFIIEHFQGSRIPFRIVAVDEDEALEKVFNHMGSTNYKIVGVIE